MKTAEQKATDFANQEHVQIELKKWFKDKEVIEQLTEIIKTSYLKGLESQIASISPAKDAKQFLKDKGYEGKEDEVRFTLETVSGLLTEFASPKIDAQPKFNVNGDMFGMYCTIEQKRYLGENEHYQYKIINKLESNTWVDVPVDARLNNGKEIQHQTMEQVVSCICCGVSETEVLKFRLKDVKISANVNSNSVTMREADMLKIIKQHMDGKPYKSHDESNKILAGKIISALSSDKGEGELPISK